MGVELGTPVLLSDAHGYSTFSCGEPSLDTWLIERARDGQNKGSARTFVVCDGANRVIGYYALSAGSVIRADAPGYLRRNMPDPLPVIVLGRLAIDTEFQGQGTGSALLRDAVLRAWNVSQTIGAVALIVHALNSELRPFYERFGFKEFPSQSLKFFLRLEDFNNLGN